jgi:starch synthase
MSDRKLKIYYFSTECYPAAKVGGLGDVVGSLPRYLNEKNAEVSVIIPKYKMPWFEKQEYTEVFQSVFFLGSDYVTFKIEMVNGDPLGFPVYVIDIPGKFDRFGVYADEQGHYFMDETERYISFARAALNWMISPEYTPDIIHCHDHHTGLIPFMAQYCFKFRSLSKLPLVFTIHNERYQGAFSWDKKFLMPEFDTWKAGMMDWNNRINPLASAVKCCWKVTTVSQSYMEELKEDSFGLEWLFKSEGGKCVGILNGIDNENWDPKIDPLLEFNLKRSIPKFKSDNKKALLQNTNLDPELPLISFIGRFALEKGADLLSGIIDRFLGQGKPVQFLVLGTGDKAMEHYLSVTGNKFPSRSLIKIAYNEKFAHQIYAGSDFLIMPSRVEPCGLNQMYSLRYGTIPIVHNIGGLKDSIIDIDQEYGSGIKTESLDAYSLDRAINRAIELYSDKNKLDKVRKHILAIDYSWNNSAAAYINMYRELLKIK